MSIRAGTLALLTFAASAALVGCENDCQQMCREFADIYEECGVAYGDSELRDCLQEYRIPDKTLLTGVCEYGMRSHPDHGTTLRADLATSADDGDLCATLDDWRRTVGGE